tara:strand:- start:1758 stop:1892 length:135 start_codon:yes stop_codon:yes gene_type:complete
MEKERLFNFLLQDLEQLKKDIKNKKSIGIENFFFYWEHHINKLK